MWGKGLTRETIAKWGMRVKFFQRNNKLLFRGNPASWLTGVTYGRAYITFLHLILVSVSFKRNLSVFWVKTSLLGKTHGFAEYFV